MNYTNAHGLPDFVVKALAKDEYTKGDADFSVTELMKSPQEAELMRRHESELTMEIAKRVYSVFGTAVHKVFDLGEDENVVKEKRVYFDLVYDGETYKVGLKPDAIEGGKILDDFKVTSVWAYMLGGKDEWATQLNCYAFGLAENGIEIERARIIALMRDWQQTKFDQDPFNYPPPIYVHDIKLNPLEQTYDYLMSRLQAHVEARKLTDDQLPPCTNDERWARGEKWAVKRRGNKRALSGGVKESAEEAQEFAGRQTFPTEIEHRKPKNNKCENYCVAAPFCTQWEALSLD